MEKRDLEIENVIKDLEEALDNAIGKLEKKNVDVKVVEPKVKRKNRKVKHIALLNPEEVLKSYKELMDLVIEAVGEQDITIAEYVDNVVLDATRKHLKEIAKDEALRNAVVVSFAYVTILVNNSSLSLEEKSKVNKKLNAFLCNEVL